MLLTKLSLIGYQATCLYLRYAVIFQLVNFNISAKSQNYSIHPLHWSTHDITFDNYLNQSIVQFILWLLPSLWPTELCAFVVVSDADLWFQPDQSWHSENLRDIFTIGSSFFNIISIVLRFVLKINPNHLQKDYRLRQNRPPPHDFYHSDCTPTTFYLPWRNQRK